MSIKSILVLYNGGDKEASALEFAFNIAEKHKARVNALYVSPNPANDLAVYAAVSHLSNPTWNSIYKEVEEIHLLKKEEALGKFLKISEKYKVEAEFTYETGNADKIIAGKGKMADIIIISRAINYQHATMYGDTIHSSIFATGRMVLLIPAETKLDPNNLKVAVAWNGSPESSRAVAASLPILQNAREVNIIHISSALDEYCPDEEELIAYLGFHGIKARIIPKERGTRRTASALLEIYKETASNLLIMGAYSHSFTREAFFGGTTMQMIDKTDLTVAMVH